MAGEMNDSFRSAGNTLASHLVVPVGREHRSPGVILCHGFPIGPLDARRSAGTYPQVCDRIAHDLGYVAMTFTFRGCGDSTGDFSLQGWIDDLRTAIDHLIALTDASNIVLDRHQHGRFDRHLRRRRRPAGSTPPPCSAHVPTSTTGPRTRAASSSTPASSARSARPGSRRRSTSGAGRSTGSGRSRRPADSPPGRCW